MFKNLSTSTKLLILCVAFVISVALPVWALVVEKRLAIDFARKELIGSRYLATVRDIHAAIISTRRRGQRSSADVVLKALADAEAEAGAEMQTRELAQGLAAAVRELWDKSENGEANAVVLHALAKAQALAARIGDDSKLALDPDLDSYHVQSIVVRTMPEFLGRLTRLQQHFETSMAPASPAIAREVHLPILASLLLSTASDVQQAIAAAYRGNADGSLRRAVAGDIAALISSMDSYLGALDVGAQGIDARDAVGYSDYHAETLQKAIKVWAVTHFELDRLIERRIDGLVGRMRLELAVIGTFAGLSILMAVLTHWRIVRPLQQLEAVASAVRKTKDYSLRADYSSQDEIGRVAVAFNGMLSELAAARDRETAERAEFSRATRLTAMGEMAASIAHEVNQPLAAIVAGGNAGLRWLAHETPDLGKVHGVLQRVVRDGVRASEIVGSVRAMFKHDAGQRGPVDVNDLLAEVLVHLHSELQGEQVALEIDLGASLPRVSAVRLQLQQVFVNLIMNAIEAMRLVRDRPRSLRVRAGIVEADAVRIAVADSGPGIDEKIKDRIFDPFFTTKSDGMGLGLAICRSIIEAHGGRVWASRGNPHGTIFQLLLPCCPVAVTPNPPANES
jgi:signal transduction histidine kinase